MISYIIQAYVPPKVPARKPAPQPTPAEPPSLLQVVHLTTATSVSTFTLDSMIGAATWFTSVHLKRSVHLNVLVLVIILQPCCVM